ncbi:MAG TPA: hypothetical protein VFV67_01440 [Actinophytocola sp.]|uniref:hypothetical protein n=1 Tax=Actinophytocola sp. TaxID=1872138 RepID=UPI002DBC98EF|nr:hypothetical protein [Actinophytocola sp.]HEU5469287.1 hypothetical protein [Actinophytocola sp.]
MIRRLVPVAVLAAAAAGCSDNPSKAAPTTVTVATQPSPNQVECSNVERAYNAWKWTPTSSLDFTDFNVRRLAEKGGDFYKAVEGYRDKGATGLALEIARYNYDLSVLNATYVASGSAPGELTTKVVSGVEEINNAYATFRRDTCA